LIGGLSACATLLLLACLAVCTVTDLAAGLAFDMVTLPTLAAILLCEAFAGQMISSLKGAAAASGALVLLFALTKGRGIGLGDVKLGGCIGGALGTAAGLNAIGISFIFGAIFAVVQLARGAAHRGDAVPFVPFLTAATVSVVLRHALT